MSLARAPLPPSSAVLPSPASPSSRVPAPPSSPARASGILGALLGVVLPVQCVGCGRWDTVLCADCARLADAAEDDWRVLDLGPPLGDVGLWTLGEYQGALRRIVLAAKHRDRVGLEGFLAQAGRTLGTRIARSGVIRAEGVQAEAAQAGVAPPRAGPTDIGGIALTGPEAAPETRVGGAPTGTGPPTAPGTPSIVSGAAPEIWVVPAPSGWRRSFRGRLVAPEIAHGVAAALAEGTGRRTRVIACARLGALSRTQSGRTGEQRRSGRAGAMTRLVPVPPGVPVVLVDDVVTTGATVRELARMCGRGTTAVAALCRAGRSGA